MELYERPANRFVAGFIGAPAMNVLPVGRNGAGFEIPGLGTVAAPAGAKAAVEVGIRPEHLVIDAGDAPGGPHGRVELVERLGADTFAYVRLPGQDGLVTLRLSGETVIVAGAPVRLKPDWRRAHWFDAEGNAVGSGAFA
jgi:ABC-type sugar transport system ATPase subunit